MASDPLTSDPKLNGKITLQIPLTRLQILPSSSDKSEPQESLLVCSICSQKYQNDLNRDDKTSKRLVFKVLCNHLNQSAFYDRLEANNELDKMLNEMYFCPECMAYGCRLFHLDQDLTALLTEICQLTRSFREIILLKLPDCLLTDSSYVRDFKSLIEQAPELPVTDIVAYSSKESEPTPESCETKSQCDAATDIQDDLLPALFTQTKMQEKVLDNNNLVEDEEERAPSAMSPSPPFSPLGVNVDDGYVDELKNDSIDASPALDLPVSELSDFQLSISEPQKKVPFVLKLRNPENGKQKPKRKFGKPKLKVSVKEKTKTQKLEKCDQVRSENIVSSAVIPVPSEVPCKKEAKRKFPSDLPEIDKEGYQEMTKLGIPFRRVIVSVCNMDSTAIKSFLKSKHKREPTSKQTHIKSKKSMKLSQKLLQNCKKMKLPKKSTMKDRIKKISNKTILEFSKDKVVIERESATSSFISKKDEATELLLATSQDKHLRNETMELPITFILPADNSLQSSSHKDGTIELPITFIIPKNTPNDSSLDATTEMSALVNPNCLTQNEESLQVSFDKDKPIVHNNNNNETMNMSETLKEHKPLQSSPKDNHSHLVFGKREFKPTSKLLDWVSRRRNRLSDSSNSPIENRKFILGKSILKKSSPGSELKRSKVPKPSVSWSQKSPTSQSFKKKPSSIKFHKNRISKKMKPDMDASGPYLETELNSLPPLLVRMDNVEEFNGETFYSNQVDQNQAPPLLSAYDALC